LFYISRILWGLAQPGTLLVVLIVAGALLLATRYDRVGRWLVIAAAVLGFVGGVLPLSTWVILPLEDRFPRADLSGRPIDGIVVLGGGEDARVAAARGAHALNMSGERLTEAAALARRYPNAKVVFTGGSSDMLSTPVPEANAAANILRDLGVDGNRLVLEGNARNTWENAINAKRVADPKPGERWLLVTSSWHMPRAIGLFRKAGFNVEAWPTDYRTSGYADVWMLFGQPGEGLRRLDFASKEWVGLLVNWLRGRSDELLPAP
jgi:uncharacterized SAM-binding protein YcdF (DUF218 family)